MVRFINVKVFKCISLRIFCCRRSVLRKRTICFTCLFIIFTIIFGLYMYVLQFSKCSFSEVEKAVYVICDKYQNREALGNLCADLCELNHLKPNNCLPNHLGKDVVFEATYFIDHVVMKSSKLNSEDFDQISYIDAEGNRVHPTISVFLSMVINTIQSNLDITVKSSSNQSLEILTKIWTRNMKNFNELPISIQNTAMNNIWFLMQQTEYLLMKYYDETHVFPKVLGTCGPFYAVEFIQPLDNYFLMLYPSWGQKFYKRAELALKILNFLEETEQHFPSLHFCDVKVGHFGLDKDKNVKLLDMDMVFFEPQLMQNIVSQNHCSSDNDCSFIDCKGTCDTSEWKCLAKVTDNNFQRVCLNIFSGRLLQSYFGLLSSPPPSISTELYSLLKKCSEPMSNEAAHILLKDMKHILQDAVIK